MFSIVSLLIHLERLMVSSDTISIPTLFLIIKCYLLNPFLQFSFIKYLHNDIYLQSPDIFCFGKDSFGKCFGKYTQERDLAGENSLRRLRLSWKEV